eukprot:Skav209766  [mRNA]  locus=scaffold9:327805:332815:+ [translate_table: standard]
MGILPESANRLRRAPAQAVAFALTGAPRLSPNPKVLTARGAEEAPMPQLDPISRDGTTGRARKDKLSEGQPITVYVAEVQNPDRPKDRDSKFVLAAHKNKIVNPYQLGNASNIEDLKALVAEQKGKEEKVYYTGVVTAKKELPGAPLRGILRVELRVFSAVAANNL